MSTYGQHSFFNKDYRYHGRGGQPGGRVSWSAVYFDVSAVIDARSLCVRTGAMRGDPAGDGIAFIACSGFVL